MGIVPHGPLRLRQKVTNRDVSLGRRFQNVRSRDFQVEVLLVGIADQSVENRIVEDGPPRAQVGCVRADARLVVVDPLRGHSRGRHLIVRTDLEAVLDELPRMGTAGKQHANDKKSGRGAGRNDGVTELSALLRDFARS